MAAAAKQKNPKQVTIYGRLSYPTFSYAQAVKRNLTSQHPKDAAEVAPDYNLLVEAGQLKKFVDHIKGEFFPYCLEQATKGEKRDALDQKQVDRLLKIIDNEDWEAQPPYISIKAINDKTAALAPECSANIKVNGNKGVDVELRAIVNSDAEIVQPDPALGVPPIEVLVFPAILPIDQTVHNMYGGCLVAVTLNLYAFASSPNNPGFSASSGVLIFKADADRFGGGGIVDEDEIFLD